jgi:class 3 adenylate cyclase/tetratricopeptide (TPR) repeat protein
MARKEHKVVTVLFADLVGFTSRAEELDPEDVEAILRPYHERLRGELERFGGTVEKFIGDAVMAVFGAPVAHEDDPERAVRAALAIRDQIVEDGTLAVRIAVTTGEALVSVDARPEAGEGMVAGDVVNTAARLQSAAPTNSILVGETTYRATQDTIEYREHEAVEAKGKAEPIPVWEVVNPRARVAVELRAPATPLVGRGRERELLLGTFERVRADRSTQLFTIVGVPGIGKSRLVAELYGEIERDPELTHWRQGRSLPYGEGGAFWAFAEMAKAEAGILDGDSAADAERKLHEALAALVPPEDADWLESRLRPLVGLEAPPGTRDESFAAWRRFAEALAERHPTVLVFEDLHWADDDLLDFVDELVDWVEDVPMLVLGTARPELLDRRPNWGGGKRNAQTLSLPPLGDDETARLLGSLLNRSVLPAETQQALLARAGGNPLYAEEYVRMLAEAGPGAELPLPETVQGIIAARLDTLAGEEKALVQEAAVVGKVFWVGALAAVTDRAAPEVEDGLQRLERKEFVRRERRSSVAGETAFVFRHVLVRDVAYGQIPRSRRAELHRRAAEWLESLAGDRAEDIADLVAHHYLSALQFARAVGRGLGDLPERAREALADAGDRALALSAYGPAVRFYREALASWPEDDAERPPLLLRYGQALFRAEQTGADVLAEAARELLEAGELELAAEAEVLLGDLLLITQGRRDESLAHFDAAVALLFAQPPSRSKVRVLASRAHFHLAADEAEEAARTAEEALELAEALGLDDLRAHTLSTLGFSRVMTGDLDGLRNLQESVDVAALANSPQVARGYNNLASVTAELGDLPRAFELYAESRRAAARFGDTLALRWLDVERMFEHYWRGNWDDALALGDVLLGADEEGPASLHRVDVLLIRAKVAFARVGPERALDDVDEALELARAVGAPQILYPTLAFHAHAHVAAGRPEEGAGSADELLALWLDDGGGASLASFWLPDLTFALAELGREGELVDAAGRARTQTRWLEAAVAAGEGDWVIAADLFARVGSLPDEAHARLRAAAGLAAADRAAEADDELRRASAFYRDVEAAAAVSPVE